MQSRRTARRGLRLRSALRRREISRRAGEQIMIRVIRAGPGTFLEQGSRGIVSSPDLRATGSDPGTVPSPSRKPEWPQTLIR